MTDYGVRRKFEVQNIEQWIPYENGVKFKHANNLDVFDFPIATINKMLEEHYRFMISKKNLSCKNCSQPRSLNAFVLGNGNTICGWCGKPY